MTRLIVRHHRPWYWPVIGLVLLLVAGAGGWGLYQYGYQRAGYDCTAQEAQNVRLYERNRELEQVNTALREKRAVLERSEQIEQEAARKLERNLMALQGEIAELKEELAFYRGIVSPEDASRGLQVGRLRISDSPLAGGHRYHLVLTQVLKNDTVIDGVAKLVFEGTLDGEHALIPLSEVSPDGVDKLDFRFKYFQNFEGDVVLPERFEPTRVIVKVQPNGKKYSDIEQAFEWPGEET